MNPLFSEAQLSVNPLGYWMAGTAITRTPAITRTAFEACVQAGFTRVKADVFDGWTPSQYAFMLKDMGLAPGLSMFMSTFDRSTPIAHDIEHAKRYASQQSELGLKSTMICAIFVTKRTRDPAVGADFDRARLDRVVEDLGAVCQALNEGGIHPLLHPHVGGWIETEEEVEYTLANVPASELGFGPDTGHLEWAGMDSSAMIKRHESRVGGVHIKDLKRGAATARPRDYAARTASGAVWVEPGGGVIDFKAVFDALPSSFAGEFVIEIDVPTTDPFTSLQECRTWANSYFAA